MDLWPEMVSIVEHYSTLLIIPVFQFTVLTSVLDALVLQGLDITSVKHYHGPLGDYFPRCLSVSGECLPLDTGNKVRAQVQLAGLITPKERSVRRLQLMLLAFTLYYRCKFMARPYFIY